MTIRVLLFTASSNQPVFLRHCIYQMQVQTVNHVHGIYVNNKQFNSHEDSTNYLLCLSDIPISNGNHLEVAYGPTSHQHHNHMAAINLFNFEEFDLFIKIDDDDIYRPDYVESVIDDYRKNHWDMSATFSNGILNNRSYDKEQIIKTLNSSDENLFKIMPGSLAFSKSGLTSIKNAFDNQTLTNKYEDNLWTNHIASDKHLSSHIRSYSGYTYNVHGDNFSTSHHFSK